MAAPSAVDAMTSQRHAPPTLATMPRGTGLPWPTAINYRQPAHPVAQGAPIDPYRAQGYLPVPVSMGQHQAQGFLPHMAAGIDRSAAKSASSSESGQDTVKSLPGRTASKYTQKQVLVVDGSNPKITAKRVRQPHPTTRKSSGSSTMSPTAEVFVPLSHVALPTAYATTTRASAPTGPSTDVLGPRVPSPPAKRGDHYFARPAGASIIHAPPYDNAKSPNPFLEMSPPSEKTEKKTLTPITGFYIGTTMVGETAALSGGEACVWAIIHSKHLVFVPRPKDEHPIVGMWGNRPVPETTDFEKCQYKDILLDKHLAGIPQKTLNSLCMSVLEQNCAKNGFLFKHS